MVMGVVRPGEDWTGRYCRGDDYADAAGPCPDCCPPCHGTTGCARPIPPALSPASSAALACVTCWRPTHRSPLAETWDYASHYAHSGACPCARLRVPGIP